MDEDIEHIFSASREEMRAEQAAERDVRKGNQQSVRAVRRQFEPRAQRGFDTVTRLFGLGEEREVASDAFNSRLHEWYGSEQTGPGIRDMNVNEVFDQKFARPSGRENMITYHNRAELQEHVLRLAKITPPFPNETTEAFILRAMAVRDGVADM